MFRQGVAKVLVFILIGGCGDEESVQASRTGPTVDLEASAAETVAGQEEGVLEPIGWDDGDAAVAVSEDGTVALRQGQSQTVLVYDADGSLRGRAGGIGEGPGKFTGLFRIGWKGDSLWAADLERRRITLFGPTFDLERTISYEGAPFVVDDSAGPAGESGDGARYFSSVPLRLLAADRAVTRLDPGTRGEAARRYGDSLTIGIGGVSADTIGALLRVPLGKVQVEPHPGWHFSLPLPRRTTVDVSRDARWVAVAIPSDEHLQEVEVRLTGVEEDRGKAMRLHVPPVAVSDSLRRARAAGLDRRLERAVRLGMPRAARKAVPEVPRYLPPVQSIVVGDDQRVWLEIPTRDSVRTYLVVAPNGRVSIRVRIPRPYRLVEASTRHVWALYRDRLGRERLVRWALPPSAHGDGAPRVGRAGRTSH